MRQSDFPSSSQISKMRERLNQIEQQIRRSQLAFANDITISNISGRNLTLTLNIATQQPETEHLTLQSKINMPNHSAITHRITSQNGSSPQKNYSQEYSANKRNALLSSAKRNKESEEKHLDSNREERMRDVNGQMQRTVRKEEQIHYSYESPYKRKKKDIVIQDDPESEIEEEQQLRPFSLSNFKNHNEAVSHEDNAFAQTKYYHPAIKPQTNNQAQAKSNLQQSPQVLNYLRQQYRPHQPEINTPYQKGSLPNPNLQTTKQAKFKKTTNSKRNQAPSPIRLQTSQILVTPPRNSTSRQIRINNLFSQSGVNKITTPNMQSESNKKNGKQTSKKRQYSSQSKFKENKQIQSYKQINRADALFMERKAKQPKIIEPNSKEKYFKNYKQRLNRFANPQRIQRSSSKTQRPSLSPKIQQITQRLYGRSKSPCWHNRRFNESQQRQRFHHLVNENPLVCRHMCEEQKQQLFQKLRHEEDSISLWPMKIVNYTYSKLKKSQSLAYSLLQ